MSTIAVNAITDASGGNTASINGATPTTDNTMGRNRIINGNFLVAQRGTSFTGVSMSGADSPYNLDRWQTNRANVGDTGACTISQVTGGGIRYETTTADTTLTSGSGTTLRQLIEGYNCVGLAGNPLTVSFKMKTNKLGTYGVWLYDYTASSYQTPQSITVTSSGTVESYSLTFPAISAITIDNNVRLGLNITLVAQATREGLWYPAGETQVNLFDTVGNYVEVYDVQLEVGSVATSFERVDYSEMLRRCQRYYTEADNVASNLAARSYSELGPITFPVDMRATPTVAATLISFNGGATGTLALFGQGPRGFSAYNSSNNSSINYLYGVSYTATAEL